MLVSKSLCKKLSELRWDVMVDVRDVNGCCYSYFLCFRYSVLGSLFLDIQIKSKDIMKVSVAGKQVVGPLLKRKLPPVSPQLRSISCRLHVYNTRKSRYFLKRTVHSTIAYMQLFTTTSTTYVQLYVLQANLYCCFRVGQKPTDCASQYQRTTAKRGRISAWHEYRRVRAYVSVNNNTSKSMCPLKSVCVCVPPTSVYFFHHTSINSFCHQRRSIISPCLLLTAISSSITQSKLRLFKKKKKRFSDTNKYKFYHQIRHLFGTADIKSDDSFQKGWTFILPATREANQSLLLLI